MSPHHGLIAVQLRQLIYYHLDHDLLGNALFFAGRLHALDPRSADTAHLLALCHLRLGQPKAAYDYSKERSVRDAHIGCIYVFAQACLSVGRFADGIGALERARASWNGRSNWNKHSESSRRHLPDAAAINCLLGKLWRAHGDDKKAVQYYVEALRLNSFMWDAFLELCDMGARIYPHHVFTMTAEMTAQWTDTLRPEKSEHGQHVAQQVNVQNGTINSVLHPPRNYSSAGLNDGGSSLLAKLNGGISTPAMQNGHMTPGGHSGTLGDESMLDDSGYPVNIISYQEPPKAPLRKTRIQQTLISELAVDGPRLKSALSGPRAKPSIDGFDLEVNRATGLSSSHKRTISGHASLANPASALDAAAPQRRSVRLFNQIRPSSSKAVLAATLGGSKEGRELKKAKAMGTKGRSGTASTVARVVSSNRRALEPSERERELRESRPPAVPAFSSGQQTKDGLSAGAAQQEAAQWLLDLLARLGDGYFSLSRYQCQTALQIFNSVPSQQRDTPWVLSQIGKAHYESSAYAKAEEVFARVRRIAPSRMEDMETYSTVLWHLKSDVELAFLAHELVEADRLAPQAWCAIGNSFSLQRDHEQAIRCFRRATQLDPNFAYAFTLQGHEHVANEEFEKALSAYRNAVFADNRHYNGWYGLGRVYEKMAKFDTAEKHFRCAAQINPTNALLVVCVGIVLEKMKKTQGALAQYSIACDLDPRSALARLKKARALLTLRHPREALDELLMLKDMAPDEANVHFMLGRSYKMIRDKTSAIRHFTIALNLDPKAAQHIKEAMNYLEDDDDDYEDEDME